MDDVSGGRTIAIAGGLHVVHCLPEVTMPGIFMKLVGADFKMENLLTAEQDSAQIIIDALKEEPKTISAFVSQQRVFNFLDWAAEKVQMKYNCSEPGKVQCVANTSPALYQIQLSRDFCNQNDIFVSAYLFLDPEDDAGYGRINGRVMSFDQSRSILLFMPIGCRDKVSLTRNYQVRFHASSFVFKSCERTLKWLITLGSEINHIVFPEAFVQTVSIAEFEFEEKKTIRKMAFSTIVKFNEEQKATIFAITSGHNGKTPFLLHGPPGTGKTTTLVESVRLLLSDRERPARILVCTPSNTAADLFALELLKMDAVGIPKLFRMYSLMRNVAEQNQDLLDVMCICQDDDGHEIFGIHCKEKLLKMDVIVCTLTAATYLVSGGLHGSFSHIIVDEAGQATELHTLIPLIGLANEQTKIILAGDPKQLGPMINCEYVNKKHISKSLMERYGEQECYRNNKMLTCMLEKNYRSHPAIIKIPSLLFYNGQVHAFSVDGKETLSAFEPLPNKGFPILWHNVIEKEKREQNGFSYCNLSEIQVVKEYVEKLFETTNVQPADIGIISPYKYQVRLLRDEFESYPEMTIDSVERFQGAERRIIIVSAVRNTALGFMDCDKRFNTTIMRAEELLIVVGNKEMLAQQPSWKCFIDYCIENNSLVGMDPIANLELTTAGDGRSTNDSYVSETEEEEMPKSDRLFVKEDLNADRTTDSCSSD